MSTSLPRRGYSSTKTSSSNRSSVPSHAQSQSQKSLRFPVSEMTNTHTRSTYDARRPSSSSWQNDDRYGPSSQSGRMRREHAEHVGRILSSSPPTATSQRRSHHMASGSAGHAQPLIGLRTKDVLEHPRLQKMTGVFPGRAAKMVGDRELPPEELYRLVALLSIPDVPPAKRPLGDS